MKNRVLKKSEITKNILRILGAGIAIPMVFLFPGSGLLIKEFLKNNKINKNYLDFRRMLRQAKNKRLVEVVQKNGKDLLQITSLGKEELLRYDIDDLHIVKESKTWDGLWRVVIFDIPEKHKQARVALSYKLKEIGFYRFQKSIFVFPFDCSNEIDFIKEFFKVGKFVVVLKVVTFGEYYDLILKKYFDLL
jgi:DNA-binding transcriptional regulator PaaX